MNISANSAPQNSALATNKELPKANFDPENDVYLTSVFSPKKLANRLPNKASLQQKCNFRAAKKKMLLTVFLPFLKDQALENLSKIMEGLAELDVQLLLLSEDKLPDFAKNKKPETVVMDASIENLHLALAGSDVFFFPTGLKRKIFAVDLAMKYGAVPVLPESEKIAGILEDYDPVSEKGTVFLYKDDSEWSMFRSLVRAWETFKLPYDWKGIQRNAMLLDLKAHL